MIDTGEGRSTFRDDFRGLATAHAVRVQPLLVVLVALLSCGFVTVGGSAGKADAVTVRSEDTTTSCVRDLASDVRFVALSYRVVLGRDANQAEATFWARGFAPPWSSTYLEFIGNLAASSEYRSKLVDQRYRQILGRAPDPSGAQFWSAWLVTGSDVALSGELLASSEYRLAAGSTDEAWVGRLYTAVLGRDADQGGLTYWVGQVAQGRLSRVGLATAIWQSREHRARRVTALYLRTLDRTPDASGLAYWTGQLASNDDTWVLGHLVATQEFWSRSQTTFGAAASLMPPPCPKLPLYGKVVTIDPGHNGGNGAHPEIINGLVWAGGFFKACDTTGTQTYGGYPEHAYTWDVSARLSAVLRSQGATVILTRPDDAGVGPCVDRRAAIGNDAHANLAISIHADGGPDWGRGFHVLTPAGAPGADASIVAPSSQFATILRDRFAAGTGMPISNYAGTGGIMARSDLGGLNLSHVPKVFIECGNMRNGTDAAMLTDAGFRQSAADAIDTAIRSYLGA